MGFHTRPVIFSVTFTVLGHTSKEFCTISAEKTFNIQFLISVEGRAVVLSPVIHCKTNTFFHCCEEDRRWQLNMSGMKQKHSFQFSILKNKLVILLKFKKTKWMFLSYSCYYYTTANAINNRRRRMIRRKEYLSVSCSAKWVLSVSSYKAWGWFLFLLRRVSFAVFSVRLWQTEFSSGH